MALGKLLTFSGITLGALGAGLAIHTFLPQHFPTAVPWYEVEQKSALRLDTSNFPEVEVSFLRCGYVAIPECIAVRGASPFTSRVITYSAVLVRHPQATFLYDTGLCSNIFTFFADQPLFTRKLLGSFQFEQSLNSHLSRMGIANNDIAFALLSHLHWDHVSGIPELPGVPLYINRVEYAAAQLGLLDASNGLVRQLMGNNPVKLFDCAGPTYAGFRSSFDLFGDGSIVLVPLPGHTAGNIGMFINRSHGPRLFLLGDDAETQETFMLAERQMQVVKR
ncbi:MAG: hypothetical protein NVS4B7_06750 [Ktedonobacteraceae bacterium]